MSWASPRPPARRKAVPRRSISCARRSATSTSPRGSGVDRRAADVRKLLLEAAERAFGDGPNEQLFKRALVRGYLDPAPSHEAAADELALSRSAYFRRLKLATERVASHLAKTGRV